MLHKIHSLTITPINFLLLRSFIFPSRFSFKRLRLVPLSFIIDPILNLILSLHLISHLLSQAHCLPNLSHAPIVILRVLQILIHVATLRFDVHLRRPTDLLSSGYKDRSEAVGQLLRLVQLLNQKVQIDFDRRSA